MAHSAFANGSKSTSSSSSSSSSGSGGYSSGGSSGGYSSGGSSGGGSSKSKVYSKTTTTTNQTAKYGADKIAQANSQAANRMGVDQLKRDADESYDQLQEQLKVQNDISQANQVNAYRDANNDWQTSQSKDMQMLSNLRNSSAGYGSMGNSLSYLYNLVENNQDTEILGTLNQNINNQLAEDYETNNKNIMSYNQAIQKDYDSAVSYAGTFLDEFNNNAGYKTKTTGKDVAKQTTKSTTKGNKTKSYTTNKTTSTSNSTTTHNKSKFINYNNNSVNEDTLFKALGFSKSTWENKKQDYITNLSYLGNTRSASDTASSSHTYDNRSGKTNLW